MNIGIAIVATNVYFVLGIRFIKKFMHHYKGNAEIAFYFFSDTNPRDYLPEGVNIKFIKTEHNNWVDATNSKFVNILNADIQTEYLYYFDADTNVTKDFTEEWFIGDMVGGEHYASQTMVANNNLNYDRNPLSAAYIPGDTNLPQMYYYGAFFGGKTNYVQSFCRRLYISQENDKRIPYEPAVNDESYINHYFHYQPPTRTVASKDFQFAISDKGGLQNTRETRLDTNELKEIIRQKKDELFDIRNGNII